MAYTPIEPIIGLQPIAITSTTQKHPLGYRTKAIDPVYGVGEFIYLSGVASTVVGSAVTINQDDHSTTLLAANAIGPVGFAMSANVASQYGWYQIYGKAIAKTDTAADNARVWIDGTSGQVDDDTVDGDLVHNAKYASANGTPSAGLAELEIQYPYTDDITTND